MRPASATIGRLVTTMLAIATSAAAIPLAAGVSEYDVKAAYIYNFTHFATWPASAFDGAAAPLRICVAGDNPFGSTLATTVTNETTAGHPLIVAPLGPGEPVDRCHVLFVPANTRNSGAILRAAKRHPVLTVGEASDFLDAGGIISFAVVDGRVRFDVNVGQAAAVGLTLSSRLLQVARQVQR